MLSLQVQVSPRSKCSNLTTMRRQVVDISAKSAAALLFLLIIVSQDTHPTVSAQNLTNILLKPFTQQRRQQEANVSNPITYARLRNELYYLPTWRRFQQANPHEEQRVEVRVNQSGSNEAVVYSYYVNPLIDKSSITQADLIFEALHQLYLARYTQHYVMAFDRPQDRYIAADPHKVSGERCKRDLDYVMAKLEALNSGNGTDIDVELATFFDSIATEETGLMLGNFYWLGNWHQCGERHIVSSSHTNDKQPVDFTGRYCVASIKSPDWEARIDANARVLNETYFYYPHHEDHYRKMFRIQLGICLPESCDSSLIEHRHDDLKRLATYKLRQPYSKYTLTDLYCIPDEGSPLRKLDLSAALFLTMSGLWLMSLLLATIADYYDLIELSKIRKDKNARKTGLQKLVLSLSVIESWRTFITVRANNRKIEAAASRSPESPLNGEKVMDPNRCREQQSPVEATPTSSIATDDLRFLDAIKVVIMPFIIFGHVGLIILMMCRQPLHLYNMWPSYIHVQTSSTMYVDWYYCFTALITTYLMFATKMVHKNTPFAWIYLIFHRYWRLAPCYALAVWFGRSVFKYIGSGPIWDYGTNNMGLRAVCERESMWIPLTLTQNFHPLHEECIMPAWYIAGDFQFFLITPFLLVLLSKSIIAGYLVPICLMAASMSGRFYQFLTYSRVQSFDMVRATPDISMRTNWDMYFVYLRPYYRITSWLVGILAGHYCYMVRSGQWRSALNERSGKIALSIIAWIALGLAISQNFISLLADLMVPQSLEVHIRPVTAAAYTFHDLTAALTSVMLATVILFGYWPKARIMMEHRIWTYLSRINYFVFLYQVEVLVWLFQVSERLPDSSGLEIFRFFVFTIFILYSISLIATLLLSNPLARLETEFIGVHLRRKRPEQEAAGTKGVQLDQIGKSEKPGELSGTDIVQTTSEQVPLQSSSKTSSY